MKLIWLQVSEKVNISAILLLIHELECDGKFLIFLMLFVLLRDFNHITSISDD